MSCRTLHASSLVAAVLAMGGVALAQRAAEEPVAPADDAAPAADTPADPAPAEPAQPSPNPYGPPGPAPGPLPAEPAVGPAQPPPATLAPMEPGEQGPAAADASPEDDAPTEDDAPVEDDAPTGDQPLGSHQTHFRAQFGVRTSYITHDGYGLFSTTIDPIGDNYPVVQPTFAFGWVPLAMGDLSFGLIAMWEYGGSTSEVRGEATDLDFHRLALAVEGRYHFTHWLYAFGSVAPGAINTRASIDESVTGQTLYSRHWGFALDLTAGVAFQLYGKRSGASKLPRLWAIGEGGYGWSKPVDLSFEPEDDDTAVPERVSALELGEMAIHGPMFRVSIALTF